MFNQLLASGKITKTAINDFLRRMKKSGITKPELEAYLREILDSKNKSGLAFCSDEEGLKVDGVIASVLMNDDYRSLYGVIVDRHRLRKSKLQMANELNAKQRLDHHMGPKVYTSQYQNRREVKRSLAFSAIA
jgi:hypothetical protein